MPTYLIRWPDRPEIVQADSVRLEGIHQVLRGTALVIGRPCEVVVRRVPTSVLVEELAGPPS